MSLYTLIVNVVFSRQIQTNEQTKYLVSEKLLVKAEATTLKSLT